MNFVLSSLPTCPLFTHLPPIEPRRLSSDERTPAYDDPDFVARLLTFALKEVHTVPVRRHVVRVLVPCMPGAQQGRHVANSATCHGPF